MRTRFPKLLILSALLLSASAALGVFWQLSGNLAPLRQVRDRFPVFADVAVDPESNIVAVTDEKIFCLRAYDRELVSNDVGEPPAGVLSKKARGGFVFGGALYPPHKENF